jgi:hypothetical protein
MRDIDNGYFDNAQKRLDFLLNNKFVKIPDGSDKEITNLLFQVNIDPSVVSLDAGHKNKQSEYRAHLSKQIELWAHRVNLAKFAENDDLMQQAVEKRIYYEELLKNLGDA